jgi:thioredoxin reductase (NADPH)
MIKYDTAIVGAGPGGMSAALGAQNDGLSFKLFEAKDECWFPRVSVDSHYEIHNCLGFSRISGTEIVRRFMQHIRNESIKSVRSRVKSITKQDNEFKLSTEEGEYLSDSVVLATGTKQRRLDVPGIERFLGNSVFYHCVLAGKKFLRKKVFVVGGRNTGAISAIYLKDLGCNVEIIEKDPQLNAKDKYKERINALSIPTRLNTTVESLEGDDSLKKVRLRTPNGLEEVSADGMFVCIGLIPNNDLARGLRLKLNPEGYICVNEHMATSVPGVFAAGDITGNLKQIAVANAQGLIAMYNINKYLKRQ